MIQFEQVQLTHVDQLAHTLEIQSFDASEDKERKLGKDAVQQHRVKDKKVV